ncbi:flavodoxin domain-containing protein [Collinsella sp. An2]|uniref:flavodoxin domain-containing protein n=1 Tax=Collinsella sp. An2 TaxID=1965585 RepID=UPI000B393047|nr:flavodoxin domain-containing protein [Collinsella sp. An2]OUP10136.1 hypothetical protein B5F33_03535 [Collinsella sp. An2]
MKTVILYVSKHHGNTKRLVDAIANAHDDVDTIDVTKLGKDEYPDLSEYRLIGLASGIYYSEFDRSLTRVAANVLTQGDMVFALMTYGSKNNWYGKDLDSICRMKQAVLLRIYGCPGFDTWGPFKLMGGVAKNHPTDEEVQGALEFYDKLVEDYGEPIEAEFKKRARRRAQEAKIQRGGLLMLIKRTVNKVFDTFSR